MDFNLRGKAGSVAEAIGQTRDGGERIRPKDSDLLNTGLYAAKATAETITGSWVFNGVLTWKAGTGFNGIFTHANTADRTYTLPDSTGTVSLLERAETLSGAKTLSAALSVGAALILSSTNKTLGADANDWDAGGTVVTRVDATGAVRTVTGIGSPQAGQLRLLRVHGTNDVILANQNVGSAAANRVITGTGANVTLSPDKSAMLWYDGTTQRWIAL